ncbi:MAG: hypothetical protein AVDCRST_MAG33-1200 [uncultured Thermomicrobiales bacterium]|uniref:Uncharacterized protein n=1 Tax=uncultured Thermomicrobiales bacterium TaxID=1645740 RepID=A0A6J4USD0_9BACT|nr:MAG: hypothetical protein AVDCRST_MAG33-1200 [uncultured Thermomicrobiales bacterium]
MAAVVGMVKMSVDLGWTQSKSMSESAIRSGIIG